MQKLLLRLLIPQLAMLKVLLMELHRLLLLMQERLPLLSKL
jgi:hypothetical protein